MSRSGYSDDYEYGQLWGSAVDRATFGHRGQRFMLRLRNALDAMPVKRLITNALVTEKGEVCALGSVDPEAKIDPGDRYGVAKHFDIAPALAAQIAYENDEVCWRETPEERWTRMRAWVEKQIGPSDELAQSGDAVAGT